MDVRTDIIKNMEQELTSDWVALQLEINPILKAIAIKAYYVKFALLRKTRVWLANVLQ